MSGLPSTDPAFGSTERLRPGAALQRAVTAARLDWPIDEYRAEELLQLTTDDDYTKEDPVIKTKAKTMTDTRKLTDEEVAQIRARGQILAQGRAIGLDANAIVRAMEARETHRRSLDREVIEALLALTPAQIARYVKRAAPLTKPKAAAPRATPTPTLLRPAPSPALTIETTTSSAPQTTTRVAELCGPCSGWGVRDEDL